MIERIGSSFSAIFLGAFDKPFEVQETSYHVLWNLGVPLVLLITATILFGYVLDQLGRSILQD
ncbi:hypothetical protein [Alkalibacillus haloalkaliphilus]|uniref:hypothetical protein n=1 Tax=Alkalibacillus haloalkaliphilus TaxID=94136 RepID=UPI002936BD92|nr:hypothetical protein [Alkalibacillus haloalkaliphilus]MDV2582204.1 hypothetical protein [Alkalibacillus haloalkaliphilus]